MDEAELPAGTLRNAGMAQHVPAGGLDKIPPFDPRTGEHYWVLPLLHHVADPAAWYGPDTSDGGRHLDLETLVHVSGIGCFHCEQPWSPRLASRRCKGDPPNG